MMRYLFCVWVITLSMAGFASPLHAGEILLGAVGKSPYQIVVPDDYVNAQIEQSVAQAAELVQQAFAAQDITLTVVKESQASPDHPGIYLGNTRFAADHGVSFAPGQGWTYTWKVVGRNLIVAGNDQPDPIALEQRRPREARHGGIPIYGTFKGACEFVYRHAGARFLAPGEHGLVFLTTPVMFVPDDLNVTQRTYARDMEISRHTGLYYIANGMEPHPQALTNYGHYHHTVIDTDTHGKSHPEYFIYRAGKRQTDSRHLCFSNPDVRELIYQKILADCDQGYTLIELGQNDGFIPCGCEDCYNLYGVHPTHGPDEGRAYLMDAAWGEKLWIMHRDMALRLKEDRPGHMLMISAYSVARNPPKTFTSFPDNVIIQIMHPAPEIFAAWRQLDVPGGYAAYLYTWGNFHTAGYTPLRSRTEIKQLVETLVANDVQLIQINGKPMTYGIEGANIYAFMRMMNDPDAKPIEALYAEYIEAAYQEAAGPMSSFYRKLHQRLTYLTDATRYAQSLRNPLLLFSTIYTPELMDALESHLSTAERMARDEGVKARLAATRLEFDFLKHIVNPTILYYAYQVEQDQASHDRVLDAIDARNQWLQSLADGKSDRVSGAQPSFAYVSIATLKQNGRRMNIEPFNWDTKQRRAAPLPTRSAEGKSLTVRKVDQPVKIDSPAWQNAPVHTLEASVRNPAPLQESTTFQVLYDDTNLYVRVEAGLQAQDMKFDVRGRDAEIWLQECIHLNLSPTGDKSQYYYLNYEPVPDSYTDAQHGFITDPLHPKFGWNDNTWNGDWSYVSVLDQENNRWLSMVSVPFKTLGAEPPTKGTLWAANVGRVHFYDNKSKRELSVWAEELNVSNIPGDGYFGEMRFE